jgi:uncharacterized protein (DUF1015 family)
LAEIRPFKGMRYNPNVVSNLAKVICPPYDIISCQQQAELYQRSPYNFVRVEYAQEMPQDSPADNKYLRAKNTFEDWMKQRVLQSDRRPSLYVDDHYFMQKGKEYKRRGLVVTVKLEEWARMVVRPHEGTLAGPKSDRIKLLETINANTSPILSTFEDQSREIARAMAEATKGKPTVIVPALNGERHDLWAMTDQAHLSLIIQAFKDKPLYIADGHHRYESALTYRRERLALNPGAPVDAPFNFVLMTLVAFDDPGLLILPPHRLLRGLQSGKITGLKSKLESFFDITSVSIDSEGVWQKMDMQLSEAGRIRLVLFGLDDRNLWVLTLRDFSGASNLMPQFHTDIYKKLDVSLVDHIILEEMLGVKPEGEAGIARDEAVRKVIEKEYQLAFIIKPVRPETIRDIADAQDRMPRKSTYFFPKLPSGLLVNPLG